MQNMQVMKEHFERYRIKFDFNGSEFDYFTAKNIVLAERLRYISKEITRAVYLQNIFEKLSERFKGIYKTGTFLFYNTGQDEVISIGRNTGIVIKKSKQPAVVQTGKENCSLYRDIPSFFAGKKMGAYSHTETDIYFSGEIIVEKTEAPSK